MTMDNHDIPAQVVRSTERIPSTQGPCVLSFCRSSQSVFECCRRRVNCAPKVSAFQGAGQRKMQGCPRCERHSSALYVLIPPNRIRSVWSVSMAVKGSRWWGSWRPGLLFVRLEDYVSAYASGIFGPQHWRDFSVMRPATPGRNIALVLLYFPILSRLTRRISTHQLQRSRMTLHMISSVNLPS